jgi:hypothetical protein
LKRRIEQLMNGRFEYEIPTLSVSKDRIDETTGKNEIYRGEFHLLSVREKKVKGSIYSSNRRAIMSPSQFHGTSIQVLYEVDTAGLQEGEIVEGYFIVSSNAGEVKLPYRIVIEDSRANGLTETVTTLEEFAVLASGNYIDAFRLFSSPKFICFFERDKTFQALYESLSKKPVTYHNMEEFLIGSGLKEQVKLSLDEPQKKLLKLETSVKETVSIIKNTWGFTGVEATVDVPFLEIEKTSFTTDDFIGSMYPFEYVIKEDKLHGGRNYGRIIFSTCYGQFYYEVIVEKEKKSERKISYKKQRPYIYELVDLYMNYRMGKLDFTNWVEDSTRMIDCLESVNKLNYVYELFKVQFYIAQDKVEEAFRILEEFQQNQKLLTSVEFKAYYLYLTTMYQAEPEYVREVSDWIYNLYLENQENWQLLWMRLYLEGDYKRNPNSRLEAIKEQFQLGCRSRILYLEAFEVMKKDPHKVKRLDSFEVQVLLWACKENLIERDLCSQISEVAQRSKKFDVGIYRILSSCYDKFSERETLQAICSMLIKGNKIEDKYFSWYEKGVLLDLRITRLYEYYIETMRENYDEVLPQMVRLYFGYNNTLGYRKKAFIYANVIKNRDVDPDTYHNYRRSMEQFMEDQLTIGNINRDLTVIYENFLTKQKMNYQMVNTLSRLLFTYEFHCDNKKIRNVIVTHHQLLREQVVPVIDQKAFIQIYTSQHSILLQDEFGRKYTATIPYTIHRLLKCDESIKAYVEDNSKQSGLLLYKCAEESKEIPMSADNLPFYRALLEADDVKSDYKLEIQKKLLDFYYNHTDLKDLDKYLQDMNYDEVVKADRVKLIELLLSQQLYDSAFWLGNKYGYEGVTRERLVLLSSRIIWEKEFEEDEEVTSLCIYTFQQGKYDETMLSYLIDLYEGPIEIMYDLWMAAKAFDLDIFQLSEKLLERMMFESVTLPKADIIFDSYCKQIGRKRIAIAYIMYESYDFLVRGREMGEIIFKYLEDHCRRGLEVDKVCEMALLKYESKMKDSELKGLCKASLELTEKLIEKFCYSGLRFGFLKDFDEEIVRPYQMKEREFIQHICNPKSKVVLHFCLGEQMKNKQDFSKEPMVHLYDGIFSKELTLFLGETIHYYVTDEFEGETHETEIVTIVGSFHKSKSHHTKYQMINQLIEDRVSDKARFEKNFQEYIESEHLVNKMFTLI